MASVREALKRLQQLRMVEVRHGDATRVLDWRRSGGLVLKLGPKQSPYTMRHFDRDVFTYQPVGENAYGLSALTFRVAADQKAAALTIENLDGNGQGTFHRAPS